MTTCQQYQDERGISNDQMCRLLNDAKSPEDKPILTNRLNNLKSRTGLASKREQRILMVATDEDADRYC